MDILITVMYYDVIVASFASVKFCLLYLNPGQNPSFSLSSSISCESD